MCTASIHSFSLNPVSIKSSPITSGRFTSIPSVATPDDVAKIQEHNEREKDSCSNQDIVPERTPLNVHFKAPTDDYVKMFEQMFAGKCLCYFCNCPFKLL